MKRLLQRLILVQRDAVCWQAAGCLAYFQVGYTASCLFPRWKPGAWPLLRIELFRPRELADRFRFSVGRP